MRSEKRISRLNAALIEVANTVPHKYNQHTQPKEILDIDKSANQLNEYWKNAVPATYYVTSLLMAASHEYLRGFLHIFNDRTFNILHLATVRTLLDAASKCYWLSDDSISSEERIIRCQLIRYDDAKYMKRLFTENNALPRQKANLTLAEIKNGANMYCRNMGGTHNLNKNGRDNLRIHRTELPSTAKLISRLLEPDSSSSVPDIGHLLWKTFSGYSHSSHLFLSESVCVAPRLNPSDVSISYCRKPISEEVALLSAGQGYVTAIESCQDLFGYDKSGWGGAVGCWYKVARESVRALER